MLAGEVNNCLMPHDSDKIVRTYPNVTFLPVFLTCQAIARQNAYFISWQLSRN